MSKTYLIFILLLGVVIILIAVHGRSLQEKISGSLSRIEEIKRETDKPAPSPFEDISPCVAGDNACADSKDTAPGESGSDD